VGSKQVVIKNLAPGIESFVDGSHREICSCWLEGEVAETSGSEAIPALQDQTMEGGVGNMGE